MDLEEFKAARADVDRRLRVTKRMISSTIASCVEILEEIEAGDFPSASTRSILDADLESAKETYQDAHAAIRALLIMDLLPGDVQVLEADLQNLEGLKWKLGGLARKATKAPPTTVSAPPPMPSAASFRVQSAL